MSDEEFEAGCPIVELHVVRKEDYPDWQAEVKNQMILDLESTSRGVTMNFKVDSDTESETEAGFESEIETDTEMETVSETETETEKEIETEKEAESETETERESE